jgi:hypothetical protein
MRFRKASGICRVRYNEQKERGGFVGNCQYLKEIEKES